MIIFEEIYWVYNCEERRVKDLEVKMIFGKLIRNEKVLMSYIYFIFCELRIY